MKQRGLTLGRYDIASFFTYFTYAAGSVVIPVALVALARELGFSLEKGGFEAGGALGLGRTASMVVAMLLCGFASARFGMRRSLGWSVLLMGFGLGLCALAPAYGVLVAALMVAGIGEGTIEGLATPLVQDLHPDEPGRYTNFSHAFWSVGVLFTVLLAGYLLTLGVSWRVLIGGVAAMSLAPAALLLAPARRNDPAEHADPVHWTTVLGHAAGILRIPRFWLFFAAMFVAGGGEFCLTFWGASYIQLHFASAAWAGGVGTACFAAGMVLGRTGWGYVLHQRHLSGLIIWSAVAGAAITVFLPTVESRDAFFVLLFLSGVAVAPYWPSVQGYTSERLPATDSTMLMILLACAGVPGCGFFTWLMGVIGNRTGGLGAAFYLVPACFLVLAVLIAYDRWRPLNRAGGDRVGIEPLQMIDEPLPAE